MKNLGRIFALLVSGIVALPFVGATQPAPSLEPESINQMCEDEKVFQDLIDNVEPGRFKHVMAAGAAEHSRG